jgi:diguanylate cyclase (GGDEF)-like protein
MSTLYNKLQSLRPPGRIDQLACVTVSVIVGGLVLVGWHYDIEHFKRVVPGLAAMNPVTAICFIFLSVSVWLSQTENARRSVYITAQLFAALIILIAMLRLCEIVFGLGFGVDQMLFNAKLAVDPTGQPNHMAPNTALNFSLLGGALLFLDKKIWRGFYISNAASLISVLGSLLPIIGYLYGTKLFYGVGNFIPMALPTAILFLIIGIETLLLRSGRGLTKTLLDDGISGVMMRRLLPAVIGFPVLIGWLRLEGQRRNFYDNELGVALMVVSHIVLFSGLVWWHSFLLFRADRQRRQAEERLHELTLTDDLTGLRNRRGFFLLAEQELKLALNKRMGIVLWCVYADLDGLKNINDSMGHACGSRAIIQTAEIIKATFRDSDITARLGGDEFVVLAVSNSLEGGNLLIERLQNNVSAFNVREQLPYRLSLSLGVVRFDPDRETTLSDLIKEADQAMYENKRSNKSGQTVALNVSRAEYRPRP